VLPFILNLPSAFPRTFRSSNNLYEGTKDCFCPGGAGTLEAELESPLIIDPLPTLVGRELNCCIGLAACMGV
jgi:hypothetical protein